MAIIRKTTNVCTTSFYIMQHYVYTTDSKASGDAKPNPKSDVFSKIQDPVSG